MSVVALKNISLQIFDIFIRYYYRTIYYLTDALSNRVIFSANYIYQNISQYEYYILRNYNTFSQFHNLSVGTYWVLIIFNCLIHSFSPLDCFSKASTLLLLASMGFQSPYPLIFFFLYGEQWRKFSFCHRDKNFAVFITGRYIGPVKQQWKKLSPS